VLGPGVAQMRIMRTTMIAGFAALTLSACAQLSGSGASVGEESESNTSKIEGSQIGREGLVLHLGDKTVTFIDWVAKPGESNEYVGFTIDVIGANSVTYVVKAGTSRYASSAMTWTHPQGENANAISNVDFGDDGGGGGGGGDGGDDGCIEGCDDGGGSGDGGGGDGSDGCIEGCDEGSGGGDPNTGFGDDDGGICFEPGGCDGAGGDTPPVNDGDPGGDGGGSILL
jgi:hypothetical protein